MKKKFFSKAMIKVLMLSLIFFVMVFYILILLSQINGIITLDIPKLVKHQEMILGSIENVPRRTTPPEFVKGIYLTAYSANRGDWMDRLIKKIKDGGKINSLVIDIKDYTGYILYDTKIEEVEELGLENIQIDDIKGLLKKLKEAGIYSIARLTVFQDPALAKVKPELALKKHNGQTWYNWNGLAFTDPQNKKVWDYNINIAKEAASLGFDEINFDYMRYPSDGNLKLIDYNTPEGKVRADILEEFFAYLSEELSSTTNISVDFFGMVMDNVDTEYDLGIGQRLDSALDYFDFICPMMYPSHYPYNYLGLGNPAASPGPVIAFGIKKASPYFENKRASLRPWLQAFSIGAVYNETRIEAQEIEVEKASSTTGWLLWNARNYYEDHNFVE
jgi:hypothetical protein